ncbi:hypothetical protein FORC54_2729 [Vibrio vulnificus]|nr:hypothetical protein FORC54_2729 [Vibrio vulnificus]
MYLDIQFGNLFVSVKQGSVISVIGQRNRYWSNFGRTKPVTLSEGDNGWGLTSTLIN